jgi:hypothetical protein
MSKKNRTILFWFIIIITISLAIFLSIRWLRSTIYEGNEILFVTKAGDMIIFESQEDIKFE